MSLDTINAIRKAEKDQETAERQAKAKAAEMIQKAHAEAKAYVADRFRKERESCDKELANAKAASDSYIRQAEGDANGEIDKLRRDALAKKDEVVTVINRVLLE